MKKYCLAFITIILMTLFINTISVSAETNPIPTARGGLQFIVNNAGDNADDKHGDGLCLDATESFCTLRAAIEEANASGEGNLVQIIFDKSLEISPQSALPSITNPVMIDGRTQETCSDDHDIAHQLGIIIEGSSAGSSSNGLHLAAGSEDSEIHGLTIVSFREHGILVESDRNLFTCNHIGIDADGEDALGNTEWGIHVDGAGGTQIGTGTEEARNVVSGNDNGGILVSNGSISTRIRGNVIGADGTGSGAVPNQYGIWIQDGFSQQTTGTEIGGSSASFRNLISGNDEEGIWLNAAATEVRFNYIGTDWDGTSAIGNRNGIKSSQGTHGIYDNVISGNGGGLVLSSSVTLQRNFIGTNRFGSAPLSNEAGIQIGGASPIINANNVISGNTNWQIFVSPGATPTIENNMIGLNAAGTTVMLGSNAPSLTTRAGINLDCSSAATISNNAIFGSAIAPAVRCTEVADQCDVVSADIGDSDRSGATISNNTIGTNAAGTAAYFTNTPAVALYDSNNLTLENNTIAALNASADVLVTTGINNSGSCGNTIRGNNIGVSASGTDFDSGTVAIHLSAQSDHNLIDGNTLSGVDKVIEIYSNENIVRNHGIVANDNADAIAIHISGGFSNTVTGNDIAFEDTAGRAAGTVAVQIDDGNGNVIIENEIGNVDGELTVGAAIGLNLVNSDQNVIVENEIGRNFIGIQLESADANHIYGNGIGTNLALTALIPNSGNGVVLTNGSINNIVGGDASLPFNQIRNNGSRGIIVFDTDLDISRANTLAGNEFGHNGLIAIDLGIDLVTANDDDSCDADEGPNDLQNFPTLTGIASGGGVMGTLKTRPSANYKVDVYTSASCDPSGHGEGEQFFGTAVVNPGTSGEVSFTVAQSHAEAPLAYYTAIATNLVTGNTSEFSACYSAGSPTAVAFDMATVTQASSWQTQVGLMALVLLMTIIVLRNRRRGLMLLLLALLVLGATIVPLESVTPLVSAAETEVSSCVAFGDLLEDGSSAQSGSGVIVGAVDGTLDAPVRISALVASLPPSDYAGAASRVSDYYRLSAETDVTAPVGKPFLVGVPKPAAFAATNLMVATRQLDLDGQFVWTYAQVAHDATSDLLTFTINDLTTTDFIFTVVEHSSFDLMPPADSRATARTTPTFAINCILISCTEDGKNDFAALFDAAYSDFVSSQQFPPPVLLNSYPGWSFQTEVPRPGLNAYLTTIRGVSIVGEAICKEGFGMYDQKNALIVICPGVPSISSPIDGGFGRKVRHLMFHAIQQNYPDISFHDGFDPDRHWTYEGTAVAAEISSSPVMVDGDFRNLHVPLNNGSRNNSIRVADFWVYFLRTQNAPLGNLKPIFESGFTIDKVDAGMNGELDTEYHGYTFNLAYEKFMNYDGNLPNACSLNSAPHDIVNPLLDTIVHQEPMGGCTTLRENYHLNGVTSGVIAVEFDRNLSDVSVRVINVSSGGLEWKIYNENDSFCAATQVGNQTFSSVSQGEKAYIVLGQGSYVESATFDVEIESCGGGER